MKLAGWCINGSETIILSESCAKHGDLESFVKSEVFNKTSFSKRFKMAIDLIQCLVTLHTDEQGERVHCDLHETRQVMNYIKYK